MKQRKYERKQKYIISVLCIVLIFSTTTFASATECVDKQQFQANKVIDEIDGLIKNDGMIDRIAVKASNYEPVTDGVSVSIPKTGQDNICISVGDEPISMSLPEEVKNSEGVLTDEGYVVYDSQKEVDAIVQTIEETIKKDETRTTVRTMISIENSDAPREYHFNYDLPQGYRLVMGNELGNSEIPNDAVGIINEEGYAIAIIDSPWAKDAQGNSIATSYRIDGNTLIQKVLFNENTSFPVTADPSTIVDSRTTSKVHYKLTDWFIIPGQKEGGYTFKSGGAVGWYEGVGSSKTISVEAVLTTKTLTATFKMGSMSTSSTGSFILVNFPASSQAKRVKGQYNLKLTEKTEEYKYRNTKVTDNGKTTTVTYQWVTVRNWIDKVEETAPKYKLEEV